MADQKKEKDRDGIITDALKKVISVGVGAAFMTEDMVKNVLADLPLPKDMISGLMQNAKMTKEEFLKSMRDEISKHLGKIDINNVTEELADKFDIEINTKISFKKKKKD